MATHYTAVVTVHKTTHVTAPQQSGNYRHVEAPTPPRESVDELAKIVVRAASVEKLREKLAAHVSLIEEEA